MGSCSATALSRRRTSRGVIRAEPGARSVSVAGSQRSGRDVATSKRVISTLRGTGRDSTGRAAPRCWARCRCRCSMDSHRSDRTARPGSRGSAASTYSRQPSSCREVRIPSTPVSTNRSRSSGSTENTPCTITMAMRLYRRCRVGGRLAMPIARCRREAKHSGPDHPNLWAGRVRFEAPSRSISS